MDLGCAGGAVEEPTDTRAGHAGRGSVGCVDGAEVATVVFAHEKLSRGAELNADRRVEAGGCASAGGVRARACTDEV